MSNAAPDPKENQGQPLPRIDSRLKVTGEARYAADIAVNNLAYGVLVTSDIARGKVTDIKLDEARAVPGVVDIVSYGDMDGTEKPKFGNAWGRCISAKSPMTGRSSRWSSATASRRQAKVRPSSASIIRRKKRALR